MSNEQWEITQWVTALGGAGIVGLISYFILNIFDKK